MSMVFRRTAARLHVPMIRFRYAIAKSGGDPTQPCNFADNALKVAAGAIASGVAGAAGGAASSAAAQPQANVFDSFDDLPAGLRPHQFSDAEIETVLMGGAAPYVPKHLQKKKK